MGSVTHLWVSFFVWISARDVSMKIKEFFSKWKEGIKTLPPLEQLKAKRIGIYGTIFGVSIGFTIMAFNGAWYFLVLGFFIVWLQFVELIGTNQQIKNAQKIKEQMAEVWKE